LWSDFSPDVILAITFTYTEYAAADEPPVGHSICIDRHRETGRRTGSRSRTEKQPVSAPVILRLDPPRQMCTTLKLDTDRHPGYRTEDKNP
jgi:hypothetical protein